jgi:hypothetical protein
VLDGIGFPVLTSAIACAKRRPDTKIARFLLLAELDPTRFTSKSMPDKIAVDVAMRPFQMIKDGGCDRLIVFPGCMAWQLEGRRK